MLWTANVAGNYYRLCRTFNVPMKQLGPVCVNRFQVGEVVNDFSTTGIQNALASNGICGKKMYSDIGILKIDQKDIADSQVVLQAHMHESCFYPYVQYDEKGELCMSYTMDRKHIRLAGFEMGRYV